MRIVIKDTKNENITTKFKIAEGGQAQVDVSNKSDTSLRMRGKNFYIYWLQNKDLRLQENS